MVGGDLGRRREIGRRGAAEAGDGEGSVEVLPHLGDYPISDGPGVNPGDGAAGAAAAAFDEYGGPAEGDDGLGHESEGFLGWRGTAGEHAHQVLVVGRTMEPPIQVWGYNLVHRVHVSRAQGLIQGADQPSIAGITVLQSFLRVSQFLQSREGAKKAKEKNANFLGRENERENRTRGLVRNWEEDGGGFYR